MKATIDALLEISLYSAAITGAILLFRALFKKRVSAHLQYLIWGLLILRLALPVTFESGFHVKSLFPEAPVAQTWTTPSVVTTPRPTAALPAQSGVQGAADPADAIVPQVKTQTMPKAEIDWYRFAFFAWLGGIAVYTAWMAIVKLRYRRRMKLLRDETPPEALALYRECRAALSIKREIPLWVVDAAMSPGVASLGGPVLLVPAGLLGSGERLRFALLHELTHIMRRDPLVVCMMNVLRAAYWFNPAVHLAFSEMLSDMETACDADVLAFLRPGEKKSYLATIISLFSFETLPQLSMANLRTRRMARLRLRGAFMRKAASRGSRVAAAALALVLFVGCFTTACQPTPETEIVVNKGDDDLGDAISSTPPPEANETPYEAPAHYDGAETFFDGLVNLTYDMDVRVPAATKYPVYAAAPASFTQEQAETIIFALMGDVPMTYADDTMTKTEILEKFLLPAMKDLEDAKAGKTVGDDGGEKTVEELQEQVDMFQQWYDDAPETKDTRPVTAADYADMAIFLASAELGKAQPATLRIVKPSEYQSAGEVEFLNGTEYIYNGFEDPTGDLPLETTRDEAIALASSLVEKLGAEDFILAAVGKTTRLGSEYDIDLPEYRNTMAYAIVFTRVLDGIPFGYCRIDTYSGGSEKDSISGMLPAYERIMVIVDDTGIANVFWNGNMHIGKLLNENVALLPFDEIVARATQQLKVQCSYLQDTGSVEGTLGVEHFDLTITRAELKYMFVRERDSLDFITVPVWDFYGVSMTYYDHDSVDAFNSDHPQEGWSMPYEMASEYYYYEYVTINAIDGSVVDRVLGY